MGDGRVRHIRLSRQVRCACLRARVVRVCVRARTRIFYGCLYGRRPMCICGCECVGVRIRGVGARIFACAYEFTKRRIATDDFRNL